MKNQQYRYLFGPVSLSNSFSDDAKHLIVDFYQCYFPSTEVLALAKHPVEYSNACHQRFVATDQKQDFKRLKQQLSDLGFSVPTLFKQYGELCNDNGVRYLAFSVDPDFNHCIDGLVMVDLAKLKTKKHQRYMPKYCAPN